MVTNRVKDFYDRRESQTMPTIQPQIEMLNGKKSQFGASTVYIPKKPFLVFSAFKPTGRYPHIFMLDIFSETQIRPEGDLPYQPLLYFLHPCYREIVDGHKKGLAHFDKPPFYEFYMDDENGQGDPHVVISGVIRFPIAKSWNAKEYFPGQFQYPFATTSEVCTTLISKLAEIGFSFGVDPFGVIDHAKK